MRKVLISLFLLALSLTDATAGDASMPVEIITHADNPTVSLTLRELRSVFSMKKRLWKAGNPITVFVLPSEVELHRAFCKKRLNIFPNQLESIWYRQVYTGTGQAPVEVASIEEMLARVANTPGSIGYLYDKQLKKSNDEKTKTITIH